jgi:Arc/MetJ-type ribon-helix-helix transcriptional regulator
LPTTATCKVTLTLDKELVAFADAKAAERHTSRSRVIREMLAEWRRREGAEAAREVRKSLDPLEHLASLEGPSADIDEMLRQIETGRV